MTQFSDEVVHTCAVSECLSHSVGVIPPKGYTLQDLKNWTEWQSLFDELSSLGSVGEASNRSRSKYVVSFRADSNARLRARRMTRDSSQRALIAIESDVIIPDLYSGAAMRTFTHRWAPSPRLAKRIVGLPYRWPQEINPLPMSEVGSKRQGLVSMILANKFSTSRNENFTLRRKIIKEANKAGTDLHVYGHKWENSPVSQCLTLIRDASRTVRAHALPRLKSQSLLVKSDLVGSVVFGGPVQDKFETLSHYRFNLITENSLDWMTEKLFDALRSGCVPIYIGIPLGEVGIPCDIAIEVPPSERAVIETLRDLDSVDTNSMVAKGLDFLKTNGEVWENKNVLRNLGREIVHHLSG